MSGLFSLSVYPGTKTPSATNFTVSLPGDKGPQYHQFHCPSTQGQRSPVSPEPWVTRPTLLDLYCTVLPDLPRELGLERSPSRPHTPVLPAPSPSVRLRVDPTTPRFPSLTKLFSCTSLHFSTLSPVAVLSGLSPGGVAVGVGGPVFRPKVVPQNKVFFFFWFFFHITTRVKDSQFGYHWYYFYYKSVTVSTTVVSSELVTLFLPNLLGLCCTSLNSSSISLPSSLNPSTSKCSCSIIC